MEYQKPVDFELDYEPFYCKKCDDFYNFITHGSCPSCSKPNIPNPKTEEQLREIFEGVLRDIYIKKLTQFGE